MYGRLLPEQEDYADVFKSHGWRVLLSSEEIDLMLNQYEENGQSFPSKEDMERRVRFGELLYVENYTRSDGTKVSGYYRRYPQR